MGMVSRHVSFPVVPSPTLAGTQHRFIWQWEGAALPRPALSILYKEDKPNGMPQILADNHEADPFLCPSQP